MLQMVKRRKVDSPPGYDRYLQHPHQFNNDSNCSSSNTQQQHQLYLHQQQQQQRLAASNAYPRDLRNLRPRQQVAPQGHTVPRTQVTTAQQHAGDRRMMQDRYPSPPNKRQYEQFQQQQHQQHQPQYQTQNQFMIRAPLQMVQSSSADSPLSLPGISTMLRMPNGSAAAPSAARDRRINCRTEMNGSYQAQHHHSAVPTTTSTHRHHPITNGYLRETPSSTSMAPEPAIRGADPRSRHGSLDSIDGDYLAALVSGSSASNTPRSQSSEDSSGHRTPSKDSIANATTATPGTVERIANPNKNSRYLREMDRREILSRIEQGEKQATLAKEYQVSRAAICNLNKHREDVMLRKDENPLAKHPKKPRPKSLKVKIRASKPKSSARKLPSPRLASGFGGGASGKGNTYEIKSRAAALLLTSLRNKNTLLSEFRRCSERLMRLVLEEALALVPIKAVEVFLSDAVKADGVGWEHPPCAVSMETRTGAGGGSPFLDLFRAIEPEQPTARASITEDEQQEQRQPAVATQANLVDAHSLPANLKYHNVFVFELSATSADAICAVVQQLQERGAVEAMISVVVLFIESEVIARVHSKYPGVKIVAAQIDPSGKAPPTSNADDGGNTDTNSSSPPLTRPPCSLEFVLSRFREVYCDDSCLDVVNC